MRPAGVQIARVSSADLSATECERAHTRSTTSRIYPNWEERTSSACDSQIGGAHDPLGGRNNLRLESFYGPNAGPTEVLIPAGFIRTVYDPVFALSPEAKRYVPVPTETPTIIPEPGLPFSLVFRAASGREDVLLRIAAAYEAASRRRVPPPVLGPLSSELREATR